MFEPELGAQQAARVVRDAPEPGLVGEAAFAFGTDFDGDPLLGMAKAIAFDVGSFCWIGWDEPGVTIDAAAATAGSRAAVFNLELAERLDRPSGPRSAAHWLVGAHALAAGDTTAAISAFETALRFARDAGDLELELLALGYVAIANGEKPNTDRFAGIADGDALAAQLHTAWRIFSD